MGMCSHGADKEELGKGGRPLGRVRRGPELHWSLMQTPGWAYQLMPVGLVTADFLAGDGKVKVTLQSELTTFLGLLKEKIYHLQCILSLKLHLIEIPKYAQLTVSIDCIRCNTWLQMI